MRQNVTIFFLSVTMIFLSLFFGCEQPPGSGGGIATEESQISNLYAIRGNNEVKLFWEESGVDANTSIEITWDPDGSLEQTLDTGQNTYTATGLTNGVEYTFTVRMVSSDDSTDDKNTKAIPGNQVVFQSSRAGSWDEVFIMDVDGLSPAEQLTFDKGYTPSLSPDGTKIVFASWRDTSYDIYIMNVDGSDVVQLTSDTIRHESSPGFTKKADKIIFEDLVERGTNDELFGRIGIMNIDGTNIQYLTDDTYFNAFPSYSPKNNKIVFTSNRDGQFEIYSMDIDGGNVICLTDDTDEMDAIGDVSFIGEKIVYASYIDSNNSELYIMNYDGSEKSRLTDNSNFDVNPRWTFDENIIAFVTDRDGNEEIYIYNLNDDSETNLTNHVDGDRFWALD